jgi:hypothetical protein
MKKIFLVAVIALFALSACVPAFLGGGEEETASAPEAVDINATVDTEASTQAAQTMSALDFALATQTLEPATPTDAPLATATEALVEEATGTATTDVQETSTIEVDLTGTPDPATTATTEESLTLVATATAAMTGTPAPTATSVYPSPTSPIAILMPPESLVPYRQIEVVNKTKGKVYISLQGFTEYDYTPVIEYDIPRFATVKYRIPDGYYKIVVYVGKEPMIDYVTVTKNTSLRIIIRRNELQVEK